MAASIKDLVRNFTREILLDDFKQVGSALGLPSETFEDGDPIEAVLVIFSERLSELWNTWIVRAIRAGVLDYAEGPWLTLKAALDFETERREKTFAGFSLVVENRGVGFNNFVPGDIRVQNEAKKTFTNVTSGTLGAWAGSGPYPTVTLDFSADEAGTGSNTPIGGIQTTPVAAPASVYVQTNTKAIAGTDEEEDPALVKRARLATGPLSPAGPKSAFEYVALSAKRPDGTSVDVTRVKTVPVGGGKLKVYLAGATGPTAGDMATAGTDVFIVWTQLLLLANPVGLKVEAYSATEVPLAFVLNLIVDDGALITDDEADLAASTAVDAFFRTLPIGGQRTSESGPGYVFASEVTAKASEAAQAIIRATATDELSADVELAEDEVATASYSVVIKRVSQ